MSPTVVESFSDEFRQGMSARASELGDVAPSAPVRLGGGARHRPGAPARHDQRARRPRAFSEALDELRSGLARVRGTRVAMRSSAPCGHARALRFRGRLLAAGDRGGERGRRGRGGRPRKQTAGGRSPSASSLLGHEDEESRSDRQRRLPSAPDDPLGRNGTYMVWRKLHQDVALFRRSLRDASRHYAEGDEAKLMAKVVGRWPNGAPVAMWPDAPPDHFDPGARGERLRLRRRDDPNGFGCPLGAHVRRSNPARQPRLRRQAHVPPPHHPPRHALRASAARTALEDDGEDRGLVFVCFNASISRQFESIQRQWLNDGNIFHLGDDRTTCSAAPRQDDDPGQPPFLLAPQAQFVTTRGGEYLFVPSMTALAAIADGMAG